MRGSAGKRAKAVEFECERTSRPPDEPTPGVRACPKGTSSPTLASTRDGHDGQGTH